MDAKEDKSARELYEEAKGHLDEMEKVIKRGERGEVSLMLSRAEVFYVNTVDKCRMASRNNPAERIPETKFRELDRRYRKLCSRGEIPVN